MKSAVGKAFRRGVIQKMDTIHLRHRCQLFKKESHFDIFTMDVCVIHIYVKYTYAYMCVFAHKYTILWIF